jgi:SAM-dependent methyltransferase/predicted transcriptional regulator
MKIKTYADVRDHLRAHLASAALGAAMELGLFWKLADQPQGEQAIAQNLGIPLNRCRYWLEILRQLDLIEKQGEVYAVSATGRATIIQARSQATWALLAQFEREYFPVGNNLTTHIQKSDSTWALQGLAHQDYVDRMREDSEYARRFTRMLYEIHQSLARELDAVMDLTDVRTLVDVAGGSGVISLALLRRYPGLRATVVEIPNVCIAGRAIAAENELTERIIYYPVDDIRRDELPAGFDAVLVCDTWFQDEAIIAKLAQCLNVGGQFLIAGPIITAEIAPSLGSVVGDFRGAMHDPGFARLTESQVFENLCRAGLTVEHSRPLVKEGLVFIQARK